MKRARRQPDPIDILFERFAQAIGQGLEGYVKQFEYRGPVEVDGGIPPEMFRKMLLLCHPDKHNNSATSQEVTRWLLEQRKNTGII